MNPPYEFAPASSPSTQKPFSRTINSPSVTHPDESPGSGRQRVKTEPSPRHLHTPHASSGWLGPYNESSPIPGSRSPRTRLGHSPAATDTRGGGGGLSDRNYHDRNDASRIQGHGVQDTHKALGWQLESSSRPGSMSTSLGHVEGSGFRRREFDPRQGHDSSGFAGPLMEPSSSVQSLVESIDDDHVLKLTEMTKKRVEHNNPTQKRQRVVSLPTSEAAPGKGWGQTRPELFFHYHPSTRHMEKREKRHQQKKGLHAHTDTSQSTDPPSSIWTEERTIPI